MGTLTIRNLDDTVKAKLRMVAAARGVSMEEEARSLIAAAIMVDAQAASKISANEIMSRARALAKEVPLDLRSATMSHKELTDAMWGEYDGM